MEYERIGRKEAQKIFEEGGKVYLLPSNIRVGNMWIQPCAIDKETDEDFIKTCNHYRYYNCTPETGRKVKFYKEVWG